MKIINNIRRMLLNPLMLIPSLGTRGLLNWMSDEQYLKGFFRGITGKPLNLSFPRTFNEKLQWLKLYDRRSEYTIMVDKYKVRDYIAQKIGPEYLIPLLSVWERPEDIDFDKLPDQFVLKCNHNSGGLFICSDKSKLDIPWVIRLLNKELKKDYYLPGREWPYKNVPRRIVGEKFMVDDSGIELKDYKFFCFNGKVKCYKIDFDRFSSHKANYYDPDCNLLPFGEVICPPDFNRELTIPENIDDMINIAEVLSKGIPFLRVDLYNIHGQIFFGELTFSPASGVGDFIPEEWDLMLGSWLELPSKNVKQVEI